MLEEYLDLDMGIFLENDNLSRKIIHRLQSGQNIDAYLITEYRFLEEYYDNWASFFAFLGYRLERFSQGGEVFYYLKPVSSQVKMVSMRRGASFLGLFLCSHFLSSGIEGKDEVGASELVSRLENSFDFNQLIRVFNPQQGKTLRKRQQSSKQLEKLQGWIITNLRELHRFRFIELSPSVKADFERMKVLRLPGLTRFWEPARRSLDLEYDGRDDPGETIKALWTRIDWDEPQDQPD
ncbi:MAG: hypothetical protein ABR542_07105 [Desulfonatronovibrio sp.]